VLDGGKRDAPNEHGYTQHDRLPIYAGHDRVLPCVMGVLFLLIVWDDELHQSLAAFPGGMVLAGRSPPVLQRVPHRALVQCLFAGALFRSWRDPLTSPQAGQCHL
jgi:hypothetical protein